MLFFISKFTSVLCLSNEYLKQTLPWFVFTVLFTHLAYTVSSKAAMWFTWYICFSLHMYFTKFTWYMYFFLVNLVPLIQYDFLDKSRSLGTSRSLSAYGSLGTCG